MASADGPSLTDSPDPYFQDEHGLYVSDTGVRHDEGSYSSKGFLILQEMQQRHFWYKGRQRVLHAAIDRHVPPADRRGRRVLDLGCGVGGWLAYVRQHQLFANSELAGADSSRDALLASRELTGKAVPHYVVDLTSLGWKARWDTVFLLDVLEHVKEDHSALASVFESMTPGGFAFLTVPALRAFWSWNDKAVGHHRRYSRGELEALAKRSGFEVRETRYFMFLLSPLVLLTRLASRRRARRADEEQLWQLIQQQHAPPIEPLNSALAATLRLESALGNHLQYPWGSSLLAVLRKPAE